MYTFCSPCYLRLTTHNFKSPSCVRAPRWRSSSLHFMVPYRASPLSSIVWLPHVFSVLWGQLPALMSTERCPQPWWSSSHTTVCLLLIPSPWYFWTNDFYGFRQVELSFHRKLLEFHQMEEISMKTNDTFENGNFYAVTLCDQSAHLTILPSALAR